MKPSIRPVTPEKAKPATLEVNFTWLSPACFVHLPFNPVDGEGEAEEQGN